MSPRRFRLNAYQICIKILKARHLPQNANPMVVVKVGNRRKKTVVRERTDSPIYNDVKLDDIFFFFTKRLLSLLNSSIVLQYFVFDLFCNLDELLSTKITIAVYLKRYLRFKFHGSTTFEVALVWDQPGKENFPFTSIPSCSVLIDQF